MKREEEEKLESKSIQAGMQEEVPVPVPLSLLTE